jgi:hypothetical protein
MYKLNQLILFFYITTRFGHLRHHLVNHLTFTLNFSCLQWPMFTLLGEVMCIVYSINASYSSYKKILRGFGPLANYADRVTAACWRSSINFHR